MKAFWLPILTLTWKDILLELRSREMVVTLGVFSFLVVIIFNFAVEPTAEIMATVSPGILWVTFTFAGILGLGRSFAMEKDRGNLEGLMLCPVSRDVIFFGKMAGIFILMLVVEALVLPLFAVLFDLSFFLPEVILAGVLATLGFAAVGTVFSAMAINTRSREIMLPLLFLPVAVPVIIAAVETTSGALQGESWSDIGKWIQLIAVFDVIFIIVSAFVMQFVLEE